MEQMKTQNKTPEKQLIKMQTSNLVDAEFKTLAIRMLKELSEDLISIKNIQSDTNDTLNEMKNNSQGIKSRVDKSKNQIRDLEDKEKNPTKQDSKKKKESKKMRIM